MKALRFVVAVLACIAGLWPATVRADDSDSGPVPYAKFVAGAQIQNGLFNVIRKSGKIYLEITPSQLDQDFVQTAELGNGLGGYGILPGGISSSALIIRFSRSDDKVVVTWPNTFFIAPGNEPAQRAIKRTFANSTVAVAPVVATDAASGNIVIDASFFLNDIYNLTAALKAVTGADKPDQAYSLDSDRTLFGPTKAFPQNVIIDADQTWKSDNPQTIDNVPDPRTLLIRVVYNIAQPPNDADFIPRLADDRVGYFDSPHLNFASDSSYTRIVRYAIRWNIQPSDPSKAVSPAKKPIVYYLSNEIPVQYRSTIRTAILRWNGAFEKIGISDAIVVRDQPDDPAWDPDDIRYNTVLWLTESDSGGFAAAAPVFDPRTGQAFRGNVVIDADWLSVLYGSGSYVSDPADRALGPPAAGSETELSRGMAREASFGLAAADIEGQPLTGQAMTKYVDDALLWTIMHESGHSLGLMHNFIGTQAYGVKLMQDKTFTTNVGLSASVMDYVGINVWPKGERQGAYWQTVLGPYDYHAIRWGYAHIPGAKTPQQETATLDRWAAQWTNPMYRFASDEDAGYENARAIDPRVARWDLTSDPLTWSTGRLQLTDELMHKLDSRWPQPGHTYDQERAAFGWVWGERIQASIQPEHFMGGEYLSRSHAGDPSAQPPLTQVPRMQEARAFGVMDKYIFSDGAWNFSPAMLNRLVYSEWEPFINATWAYNPPPRHDLPVAEMAETFAQGQLDIMFQPLMLERLDDLPLKAKPGSTMSLADLFDWTQASMYRDLSDRNLRTIGEVHRTLQQYYARLLVQLWLAPKDGTPYDAQSLARAKLVALRADLSAALGRQGLDELTRSHLESMQEVVGRALDARQLVPAPPQAGS